MSAATRDDGNPPRKKRLWLRIVLGLLVGAMTLVLIALLIYFPHLSDEPPFIAPDLEPIDAPYSQEGNFAEVILELSARGLPTMPTAPEDAYWVARDEGTLPEFFASPEWEAMQVAYWEPMQPILARIDATLELPCCEVEPPASHSSIDLTAITAARPLFEALELRALREGTTGSDGSSGSTAQCLRFAAQLSRVRNGALILPLITQRFIVGSTALARHQLASETELSAIAAIESALHSIDLDLATVSNTLRREFSLIRRSIEKPGSDPVIEELVGGQPDFFLLRNKTLRQIGEYYRVAIDEGESTGRVTTLANFEFEPGIIATLKHGNPTGRQLLGLVLTNLDSIYSKTANTLSLLELTRLQFALRRIELETGTLPTTLEALVPGTYAALPLDPFTGKPYRYDATRRIIWGTGEDGMDDGGVMDEDERGPDLVVEIPGGE